MVTSQSAQEPVQPPGLGMAARTVDAYEQRIEDELGRGHRTAYVRFAIDARLLDR